jgi:hypothetical protein
LLPLAPSGLPATSPKYDEEYYSSQTIDNSSYLGEAGWGLFPVKEGFGLGG